MNIDKRLSRGSVDRGVLKAEREYGKERRRVDQAEECAKEEILTSSSSRGECNGSHHTWWLGSSSIGTIGSIGSIGTAKSCQLGPYDRKKTCQGWEGRR